MIIKNDAQLRKVLMDKCATAVANAERKVFKEVSNNLDEFYFEYKPEEYIRTYALLNSLKHTGVKRTGNQHVSSAKAEVYFDTPHYQQGLMPLQHTPEHGMYGWSSMTGEEVLDMALTSKSPHGGLIAGSPVWNKSMRKLGGKKGIKNLIKKELKEQGL